MSVFPASFWSHANISNHYKIIQHWHFRVTSGSDNVLLHQISFDTVEGVYVGPTPQELASSQGAVQYQVLQNFYKACLQIRTVFQRRKSLKVIYMYNTVTHAPHIQPQELVLLRGMAV